MKKVFCDACNYEIKEHLMSFDPLMHVVEHLEGRTAYVDRDWNPISGRIEHFDLCLSCYNAVHFEAYKVIKIIRETVKPRDIEHMSSCNTRINPENEVAR